MRSITLYCQEGTANKQYTVTLESVAGKITVTGIGGRIGGTMTTYPKYSGDNVEAAEKTYRDLIKQKLAKGYKPGEDAAPVVVPNRATGSIEELTPLPPPPNDFRPMLLNAISEAEAEQYIRGNRWFAQQKADGVRAIVHVNGDIKTFSRTDKPVVLTVAIQDELRRYFQKPVVLDTESCGEALVIFDVLSFNGRDLRHLSCEERLDNLESAFSAVERPAEQVLFLIQTARTEKQKRAAVQLLKARGAEGVVFKDSRAPYSAGRPNTGGPGLKWKFVASASVIVSGPHGKKRSVEMKLFDGTPVGCVTIPPNKSVPETGAIIEVEYLYAYREGSLVQAVFKGVREDVPPEACTAAQLQYKGEDRE